MPKDAQKIFQFRVTLEDIEPTIWRRIQVPESYSFWDLHVAIQDSMGWLDCHLHVFFKAEFLGERTEEIGIPGDEFEDDQTKPGWEVPIKDYFTEPGGKFTYEYDFGDSWRHAVLLEEIIPVETGVMYPRCLAGERACPPEDCGGVGGYYELLKIIGDPKHKEHKEMISWLKGHVIKYHPYQPDVFDPRKVVFSNPKKRLKMVLEGMGL
jgi:hypothetical protein